MPTTYKRHTIVAGASRSQTAENFIPVAYIAWEVTAGDRGSHAMMSRDRFPTFGKLAPLRSKQQKPGLIDTPKNWTEPGARASVGALPRQAARQQQELEPSFLQLTTMFLSCILPLYRPAQQMIISAKGLPLT